MTEVDLMKFAEEMAVLSVLTKHADKPVPASPSAAAAGAKAVEPDYGKSALIGALLGGGGTGVLSLLSGRKKGDLLRDMLLGTAVGGGAGLALPYAKSSLEEVLRKLGLNKPSQDELNAARQKTLNESLMTGADWWAAMGNVAGRTVVQGVKAIATAPFAPAASDALNLKGRAIGAATGYGMGSFATKAKGVQRFKSHPGNLIGMLLGIHGGGSL